VSKGNWLVDEAFAWGARGIFLKLKVSTSTFRPKSANVTPSDRAPLSIQWSTLPLRRSLYLQPLASTFFLSSLPHVLLSSTSFLRLRFSQIFSSIEAMQSVLGGTVQKAGEAISGAAMSSNKKVADMKAETRQLSSKHPLTSDTGVKQPTHDIWLSASTGDRQGPQLLEDNFAREKVIHVSQHCCAELIHLPDYEI
jgi:hypothetical protein